MAAKLKLDLHTHPFEATGRWLDEEVVKEIVARIKAKGLDGIAVTEHEYKTYGFRFQELALRCFNGEVLIIPGQEVSTYPVEVVELFLPGNLVFRFIAHPGYPPTDFSRAAPRVQGIEIDNALHSWQMNRERIRRVAQEYGLLTLTNSDAHSLDDIGECYNLIALEELVSRAQVYIPRRHGEHRL